ncbi:MAG: uroporphyrinogen decarboxylase family protein [Eubacteriales bacterium]|nr:uroporphyrinogen decarboxylase family protein [Eubacteriales bacterium]
MDREKTKFNDRQTTPDTKQMVYNSENSCPACVSKINMTAWIENLLSDRHKKNAMPLLVFPGLALSGRNVLELITDAHVQAETIRLVTEKYPLPASVMVMDLSVEAEAFGSKVVFSPDEMPSIPSPLLTGPESAEALEIPETGSGRTGVPLAAASILAQKSGAINSEGLLFHKDPAVARSSGCCTTHTGQSVSRPLFSSTIGPFSLAGRLLEMSEALISIMIEPAMMKVLLEKCVTFLLSYIKAFKIAGANGVIIAEPSAGLLSPDMCMEFSSVYVKRIVDEVQDDYFKVILHNCGNTVPLVQAMLHTGAAGYHFGNSVDMRDIVPNIPKTKLAMGNIDPVGVIKKGSPATIKAAVKALLEQMSPYVNFILSSGCDIPPGTPLENVDAFFNAAIN